MKKLIVLTLIMAAFIAVNAQIEINTAGKVGIGTTPHSSYSLSTGSTKATGTSSFGYSSSFPYIKAYAVSYSVRLVPSQNNTCYVGLSSTAFKSMSAYDFYDISDKRQKENIQSISGALELVKSLKGVKYDLKKQYANIDSTNFDPEYKEKKEKERKNKIGFLAQEVLELIPGVVHYDDTADIYSINYARITPVLVEAIKEQQKIIDDLQDKFNKMNKNDTKKSGIVDLGTNNTLNQNTPNPFTQQTSISYTVDQDASNAMLCIYDLNGTQLKCYEIFGTGEGSQIIAASELDAGMYLYSLIVDGELIDTKRMVLTAK